MLPFTNEEIKNLKQTFTQLDDDGSGLISANELEEPLISLGFASNREDVQKIVQKVDKGGNGDG